MLKGFIFDLDGVITDTARIHFSAWKKLADELGFSFTREDNERLKGVSRMRSFEIIAELNGAANCFTTSEKEILITRKNEYYKAMLNDLSPADILPGILELISKARQSGIKRAVASISKNAPMVISRLGISQLFDYIADAAAVTRPKPDPEIFYTCASALGAAPYECIGFEDAQAGIEAIHAAGMLSVGIGVTVTSIRPDLELKDTAELNFDKILRFYNASRYSAFKI